VQDSTINSGSASGLPIAGMPKAFDFISLESLIPCCSAIQRINACSVVLPHLSFGHILSKAILCM